MLITCFHYSFDSQKISELEDRLKFMEDEKTLLTNQLKLTRSTVSSLECELKAKDSRWNCQLSTFTHVPDGISGWHGRGCHRNDLTSFSLQDDKTQWKCRSWESVKRARGTILETGVWCVCMCLICVCVFVHGVDIAVFTSETSLLPISAWRVLFQSCFSAQL